MIALDFCLKVIDRTTAIHRNNAFIPLLQTILATFLQIKHYIFENFCVMLPFSHSLILLGTSYLVLIFFSSLSSLSFLNLWSP